MTDPLPGAPLPDAPHDLSYAGELRRKALHLIALVVPLGMALVDRGTALAVLAPLAVAAVSADVLRVRSAGFARFIDRLFGPLMRLDERPPVGGPVVINGATWVLVTATLLALLFPLYIAVPAFAMFMVADAAAAIVGRRFGRHPWGGGPRTLEGSAAFVVAGLAVMALFPAIPFWAGAVSVVLAAGAEALPRPLNDNVRVPLAAAAVLFVLERFVLGQPVHLLP